MGRTQECSTDTAASSIITDTNQKLLELVDAARLMARQQTLQHGKTLLEALNTKYRMLLLQWQTKLENMVCEQYQKLYNEILADLRRKLASIDIEFQHNTNTKLPQYQGESSADFDGSRVKTFEDSVKLGMPLSPGGFDDNISKRLESKRPEGTSPGAHWILNKALSPRIAPAVVTKEQWGFGNGSSSRRRRSNKTSGAVDTGPPSKLPKLFHVGIPPPFSGGTVTLPASSDSAFTGIEQQQVNSAAYASAAFYSLQTAAPTNMQHSQQATDDLDQKGVLPQSYQYGEIYPNWMMLTPANQKLLREQASVTQYTQQNQAPPRGAAQFLSPHSYKRSRADAFPEDEAVAERLTSKPRHILRRRTLTVKLQCPSRPVYQRKRRSQTLTLIWSAIFLPKSSWGMQATLCNSIQLRFRVSTETLSRILVTNDLGGSLVS
jgi:hypothetical protein